MSKKYNNRTGWRSKLHQIIYNTHTPAGKLFDIVLLITILTSILLVMLESVKSLDAKYHEFFNIAEWIITILFTIEYFGRIIAIRTPSKYIFSFYGIIDLLSTIPKYLALAFSGTHALVALRALRLLRIFRILKLTRYVGASINFMRALKASKAKISVFLFFVFILCIILGTVMYLVEGDQESGFTSIPRSVYWAIVTLTTVGYGDIAPVTALGQSIAALIMILGYGIIAIPTGIVTAEYVSAEKNQTKDKAKNQCCEFCSSEDHKEKAKFCDNCGHKLSNE